MRDMPTIDYSLPQFVTLNEEQRKIGAAVASVRHGVVRLRASKPPLAPKEATVEEKMFRASVAYVWRMIAFMTSPKTAHQCMPVCADWDLPIRDYSERLAFTKQLDVIVDAVVDCIPKNQWVGVMRWGRALGAFNSYPSVMSAEISR